MYSREKILGVLREIVEGSKEIAPYVVIAQPRRVREETPAQKLDGYHGIHIDLLGISHGFIDIYGEKVDVARNYLIDQAIESGAKYLFFVGEDTVIPYDGFKLLHKTAEENPGAVVAGVYYIKLSDAMITVRNGNWLSIPDVSPGQLIEAWSLGMDCMLIPIEVLRRMRDEDPELPYTCIANNIEGIPFVGEDNFFVHRLHKMGVRILVNTDVQCLHMDLASGKYTAHPSVDVKKYYTNIPIAGPLTMEDKEYIDNRWISRLPEGSGSLNNKLKSLAETGTPIKFNMGAGNDRTPGYITVDKFSSHADVKQDLLELSLPQSCADEILAMHIVEHLPQHRVPEVLHKWLNILKPGGRLIIETPNIEELFRSFETATDEERHTLTSCIYGAYVEEINERTEKYGADSPHIWGYYPKNLSSLLEQIGYQEIQVLPPQGPHPGKNFRIEAIRGL